MVNKRCCWSLADAAGGDAKTKNIHGMRDTTTDFNWSKWSRSIVSNGRLAQLDTTNRGMGDQLHNIMGKIHAIDEGKIQWHVSNKSGRASLFGIASSRVGVHERMAAIEHTADYCMMPSYCEAGAVKGDTIIVTLDKDRDHVKFELRKANETETTLVRDEDVGITFCQGGARLAIQFDTQCGLSGHEIEVTRVLESSEMFSKSAAEVRQEKNLESELRDFDWDRHESNIVYTRRTHNSTTSFVSLPAVKLKKGMERLRLKGIAGVPPKFHTIISKQQQQRQRGQITRWKVRNMSALTTLFGVCGPEIDVQTYMFQNFTSRYCMYDSNGLLQSNLGKKDDIVNNKKYGVAVKTGDIIAVTLSHEKRPSTIAFSVNGEAQGDPIAVPGRRDALVPEDLRLCVQFQSGWHGPGHKILLLDYEIYEPPHRGGV